MTLKKEISGASAGDKIDGDSQGEPCNAPLGSPLRELTSRRRNHIRKNLGRLRPRFSRKSTGFTLIEILIALFIFAILGTITAIGIRTVIISHQRIEKIHQVLEEIQFATAQMRVDFIQIIPRPILSSSGEPLPALLIPSTHSIEFTTAGYANPQAIEQRGTLRRVAYAWENEQLIRFTWSVLDRPAHAKVERRVLLNHVTDFSLNYVNDVGSLVNVWITNNSSQPNALIALPRAIVVTMHIANVGVWQGVFPITSRGYGVS